MFSTLNFSIFISINRDQVGIIVLDLHAVENVADLPAMVRLVVEDMEPGLPRDFLLLFASAVDPRRGFEQIFLFDRIRILDQKIVHFLPVLEEFLEIKGRIKEIESILEHAKSW